MAIPNEHATTGEILLGRASGRNVAFIREAECIGCTLCIQACPVDAILGAAQKMHTVIAAECTDCDLCVEACPVDCIEMHPLAAAVGTPANSAPAQTDAQKAERARHRIEARNARIARQQAERAARHKARTQTMSLPPATPIAAGATDQLKQLKAVAAIRTRQYKDATRALAAAERHGAKNHAEMQARIAGLKQKADEARAALDAYAATLPTTPGA
ncbi:MAG: RnfABCDGE type electron transport complex subunit B [Pseudomonadota bacterium]